MNEKTPKIYKEFWAIILDSGAEVSDCPQSFCPHVPITTMTQYITVTGEDLQLHGWKETQMIGGEMLMQVNFIVANAQSPLIGLDDMDFNEVSMHTGTRQYIEQSPHKEQLLKIGSHLYVAAMVIPGLHNPNEIIWDRSIRTRYTPSSQLIIGEVDDLSNQAQR
eukprot:3627255-Amphidinium_carterae.1